MSEANKLKPINWGLIYSISIVIFALFIFGFISLKMKMEKHAVDRIFEYFFMAILPLYVFFWFKTKQFIFLPGIVFFTLLIIMIYSQQPLKDVLIVLSFLFSIYNICVLYLSHKHTLRHRKFLELAAKHVNEAADGFTQRPYPVGNISFSKNELIDFAAFMKKQAIAIPFIEKNNLILSLPQD